MPTIRVRDSRRSLPEQLRKPDLVVVDLDAFVEEFPLPERSVGKELTNYFQWKYDRDLVFDPLYGCIQKLSECVGGGLVNEAQEILGAWDARALPLAIPRESVVGLVRRLSDDVELPRPNPESLDLILGAMGMSPRETVYIGSRRSDIDMGRRARAATHLHQSVIAPDPAIRIGREAHISSPLVLAG